jgi:hypothetical protein
MPLTDVKVKLFGEDGNAFAIIGRVKKALRKAGLNQEAEEFVKEATSGDYNHLLCTVMKYVEDDYEDEEVEDDYEDEEVEDDYDDYEENEDYNYRDYGE